MHGGCGGQVCDTGNIWGLGGGRQRARGEPRRGARCAGSIAGWCSRPCGAFTGIKPGQFGLTRGCAVRGGIKVKVRWLEKGPARGWTGAASMDPSPKLLDHHGQSGKPGKAKGLKRPRWIELHTVAASATPARRVAGSLPLVAEAQRIRDRREPPVSLVTPALQHSAESVRHGAVLESEMIGKTGSDAARSSWGRLTAPPALCKSVSVSPTHSQRCSTREKQR